ncbi:Dihydrolipoyl dehydrogenase [bioreactor metagenome]|uniref:Dihydrolipoyl dehydrogenase n=1 Tax=bioreactor metagenome TaxID=1076179 RepID=A0A645GZU0_9ZZZZ
MNEVVCDRVLLSIGRRANTRDIGLESINLLTERGAIVTDEHMKTNQPEVYAAGDVNGKSMLAHTAYREAEVAVNNMLGRKDIMRYEAVPGVLYTNPELSAVGETEAGAKAKGLDFSCVKIPMRFSGRFVAENEGADGLCKVLIHKKHRNILGVHMIGNSSSEAVWGAALMIEQELRVRDAKEIIFPHPTVSEIIRETIWEFDD